MSVARFTVSIPDRLMHVLTDLADRWQTSRSEVVARLIEDYERRGMEAEMAEGYRALAEESRREAEESFPAQAEVVLRD